MNWMDELLEKYGATVMFEAQAKGNECASEGELRQLVDAGIDDKSVRNKILSHIMNCGYCASQVLGLLRIEEKDDERIRSLNAQLYPLPEEIDWETAKEIVLYQDNEHKESFTMKGGKNSHEFNLSVSGFYYLVLDSGQIVWRKHIKQSALVLSRAERDEAMSYGMVAGVESGVKEITAFDESLWDDILKVKLVKRINVGKLVVEIKHG